MQSIQLYKVEKDLVCPGRIEKGRGINLDGWDGTALALLRQYARDDVYVYR